MKLIILIKNILIKLLLTVASIYCCILLYKLNTYLYINLYRYSLDRYEVPFGTKDNPLDYEYLAKVDAALLDVDNMTVIPFLKEYKNPCWFTKFDKDKSCLYEENPLPMYAPFKNQLTAFCNKQIQSNTIVQLRCLPYVYILSPYKSGTSDLYQALVKKHPEIYEGLAKEILWWSEYRFGGRSGRDKKVPISQYIEEFDLVAEKIKTECNNKIDDNDFKNPCITVDGSPSTLWFSPRELSIKDKWGRDIVPDPQYMVPGIMHKIQPGARFISMLRNPVSRTYSDFFYYLELPADGQPADVFHEAVTVSVNEFNNCLLESTVRQCSYNKTLNGRLRVTLSMSMYYIFLKDWLSVFPQNQFLFFKFEEYAVNRSVAYDQIIKFLDLSPITSEQLLELSSEPEINTLETKYKNNVSRAMWPETKKLLNDFYEPYNKLLADLLNDEKFSWL